MLSDKRNAFEKVPVKDKEINIGSLVRARDGGDFSHSDGHYVHVNTEWIGIVISLFYCRFGEEVCNVRFSDRRADILKESLSLVE